MLAEISILYILNWLMQKNLSRPQYLSSSNFRFVQHYLGVVQVEVQAWIIVLSVDVKNCC